ncbi:hypothetical protein Tco_0975143 [Tanacetum coccineum]|uniref:Uncharacterized protein n=1 Tax=Tanacetum coccineum TaxID=301880 RepID=A0ABQ5EDT1_9ASTR
MVLSSIGKACFCKWKSQPFNQGLVNHQNKFTHPHPKRNFVPTVVVTKLGQVPVNIAKKSSSRAAASISTTRPVNTVAPKSKVNDASPIKYSYFKAHSPIRRDFNQKLAAKTNNLNGKVKTARVNNVTTAGSKAEVNVAVGNGEIEGNPQYALHDQGIFDSGCSRHMTGTSPYLKIIKTLMVDLLHLQEVLKEKNSVLFTETECLVLSLNFKLLDESQVLLTVPRQNNMYSFNLKNVVPLRDLNCLFANATIDESNLWHKRLGCIIVISHEFGDTLLTIARVVNYDELNTSDHKESTDADSTSILEEDTCMGSLYQSCSMRTHRCDGGGEAKHSLSSHEHTLVTRSSDILWRYVVLLCYL